MDASASPRVNVDFGNLFGFYVKIKDTTFPVSFKQKNSVVKYTRLPDFDLKSRVPWQDVYMLEPRFRRIVTIEDPTDTTTRSLKSDVALPMRMASNVASRRKIVTIEHDNHSDLHPKFSNNRGKISPKTTNKYTVTELKDEKRGSHTTKTRLSMPSASKTSNDTKISVKNSISTSKRDISATKCLSLKGKKSKMCETLEVSSNKNRRDDVLQYNQSTRTASKMSINKKAPTISQSEKNIFHIKRSLNNDLKSEQHHKAAEPLNTSRSYQGKNRTKIPTLKNFKGRVDPVPVIHVPLDTKCRNVESVIRHIKKKLLEKPRVMERTTEIDKHFILEDIDVETEAIPKTSSRATEIDNDFISTSNTLENGGSNDRHKERFDSLDIPNISLTKDKIDSPKEEISNFLSRSLPNIRNSSINMVPELQNLRGPSLNMISVKETQNENIKESVYCKNSSYIIGRATLTYTSKQKIDFQVVGSSEEISQPHLSPMSISYPMNVVSVFKKELAKRECCDSSEIKQKDEENSETRHVSEQRNDIISLNCSLVFDRNKLRKPSDIISAIKVNNSLLQNGFMCEQFQRELNFIDSFFESLQYLETSSLSEKCLTDNKLDNWIGSNYNLKHLEYGSLLSNLENGFNLDEKETMASESLCLLNLLIRDEQKRAKKLLFVLKMREDALKDFTKSQILWLENKKKQDNTDIPTLKKKQRGALLKLQHECGEMQRMRKALLTLSEKRKITLMKTKKNIEWKLQNNVDVEQIILCKKKLKRSSSADRNIAPLKCFDLSSSGCDESTTSRPKSNTPILLENLLPTSSVACAEKYVQTGDSILAPVLMEQSTSTAEEHFVVVDGGYLNILFNNLSLPQIFSSGKQYEVNEEALRNIVSTSNKRHINLDGCDVIEKLINEIKDYDIDKSSSPSTARSLVDEFDQYYKSLLDEEGLLNVGRSHEVTSVTDSSCHSSLAKVTTKSSLESSEFEKISPKPGSKVLVDRSCACEPSMVSVETQISNKEGTASVAGPLPVPAGEAAVVDNPAPLLWEQDKPQPSFCPDDSTSNNSIGRASTNTLISPSINEAEELRRQQLAIEQEIKALEQEQCQLLVVREIPDKPPPPYTPPAETRPPKPPRGIKMDETTQEKIRKYLIDPICEQESFDQFDTFVRDFCEDSLQRHKSAELDKFWSTCDMFSLKSQFDTDKIVKRTICDFKEVVTGVTPNVVSGVGARRSDHIDDILFAEWRRCEPEWTSLHSDEVIVKNQLFESIFQKVLSDTIDEYKRTVLDSN